MANCSAGAIQWQTAQLGRFNGKLLSWAESMVCRVCSSSLMPSKQTRLQTDPAGSSLVTAEMHCAGCSQIDLARAYVQDKSAHSLPLVLHGLMQAGLPKKAAGYSPEGLALLVQSAACPSWLRTCAGLLRQRRGGPPSAPARSGEPAPGGCVAAHCWQRLAPCRSPAQCCQQRSARAPVALAGAPAVRGATTSGVLKAEPSTYCQAAKGKQADKQHSGSMLPLP